MTTEDMSTTWPLEPGRYRVTTTGTLGGSRIYRKLEMEITRVYPDADEETFIPADEVSGRPAQSRVFSRGVPHLIVKGSAVPAW